MLSEHLEESSEIVSNLWKSGQLRIEAHLEQMTAAEPPVIAHTITMCRYALASIAFPEAVSHRSGGGTF